MFIDLDHFKQINDAHGHGVGDQVLVSTVATCRTHLRASDLLGRFGGEEFVVLLPHTKREAAMGVAEKVRSAIARQLIPTSSGPLAITASVGVAALNRSISDLDSLLENADSALYAAKASGRNTCVMAAAPVEVLPVNARRRVLKAGRISFNMGHSTIDCTVRTLSNTEAGLEVISTAGIPEHFKLQILADGFSRASKVLTKRDKHLEVQFE
jgi:diguanylate cyclase (GGDEF)-like protein